MASALLTKLGRRGAPVAEPLLLCVGDLCAAAAEAAAARAENADEVAADDMDKEGGQADYEAGAAAALGAALRSLGPAAVLGVLPLNLDEVRMAVNDCWTCKSYCLRLGKSCLRYHAANCRQLFM